MSLIIEYLALQEQYEAQYGERTLVIMEVGSFYETWEYDPAYCTDPRYQVDRTGKVWNKRIGHSIELHSIIEAELTFENKSKPYGIDSPHKVGFPVIAYERYRNKILAADFVLVRVDQEKPSPPKGPCKRHVVEICSPTMQFDTISLTQTTNNIVYVYIEYQQRQLSFENFLITLGLAAIDILTGQTRVCEFYSKVTDQVYAIQELYRFLISHQPRELLIHLDEMPTGLDYHSEAAPNPYFKYLDRVLELRRFDRVIVQVNNVSPEFKKLPYQIQFFNKVLPGTRGRKIDPDPGPSSSQAPINLIHAANDQIIAHLGLERMAYGRLAYILLLQHCHLHNPTVILRLQAPDLGWIDGEKHLVLTHNAIVQLDVIPPNEPTPQFKRRREIDSLVAVLDQTKTHLGRRALWSMLQNPMQRGDEINTYYQMVEEMLQARPGAEPLWLQLERLLHELPDLGRLQRKLEIKIITPREFAHLYKGYLKITQIYVTILNAAAPTLQSQMLTPDQITNFNQFIAQYAALFNFEALECAKIETRYDSDVKIIFFEQWPIHPSNYADLDIQVQQKAMAEALLQQIVDHLNTFLIKSPGEKLSFGSAKPKRETKKMQNEPKGTLITTTPAKASRLINSPIDVRLCGNIRAEIYKASKKIIVSERIIELEGQIDGCQEILRRRLFEIFTSMLETINQTFSFIMPLTHLIAKIDLLHSYAKVAFRNNYHRPTIDLNPEGRSYLEARDLRHPIIERIIDGAYVTNDIYLGGGAEPEPGTSTQTTTNRSDGLLLFGLNQVGKSSLGKAIALNILMAQAGSFVPSRLHYKPYAKLITRLNGGDNIFKGESSFATEMSELRTILRQADAQTLVIGDEIAHTSETISATAITVSAILKLLESGATFLFASHLHEVLALPEIQNIPPHQLRIGHLSVARDARNGILLYDRKLREGSGDFLYGILVAETLDLPKDFIAQAYAIAQTIRGAPKELVSPNSSRYNREVYQDTCRLCGSHLELQTHHLQEQHTADSKGMIGHMHKNNKGNLVVLCRACHQSLHSSGQTLALADTSLGKTLITGKGSSGPPNGIVDFSTSGSA